MKFLLDTHVLLWAAGMPERLPGAAGKLMEDMENELWFSAASLWEVAIKAELNRPDFQVDCRILRRGLLDNGYQELAISSRHAVEISVLPPIHKDPFDRILVAQSLVEGFTLLTADRQVCCYPAPALHVDDLQVQ
ncbi:MAG TPA: type II toxin-antitoxin system VapC family toxin [Methylothermaceae bacterium]|nr:type II toxin-antitoxin system VapC family toxin [Methylothermaceae bacterium]